jgi:hypothetical protein
LKRALHKQKSNEELGMANETTRPEVDEKQRMLTSTVGALDPVRLLASLAVATLDQHTIKLSLIQECLIESHHCLIRLRSLSFEP